MKIAVLADIHANRVALEAALAEVERLQPDQVIVPGDIVNRGPRPVECLDIILDRKARDGWLVIRGNHEDFVLYQQTRGEDMPEWEKKLLQHTEWTLKALGNHLEEVMSLPDSIDCRSGSSLVRCFHASILGNRDGLYPRMTDDEIRERIDPAASVFCVGHTHVPFERRIGDTLVVNAGSVGLPFDRDPRGCIALLDDRAGDWQSEFIRFEYDIAAAEKDFHDTHYAEDGGPMVNLILDELRNARPRLSQWHWEYEKRVALGEISIEESIQMMLKIQKGPDYEGWA
ncbi:MAG: metallophosphatase family protein [Verrucomicrobia bacterium]|nr:metallophosphatase family protein [Verrucomicrobiota bacterium]